MVACSGFGVLGIRTRLIAALVLVSVLPSVGVGQSSPLKNKLGANHVVGFAPAASQPTVATKAQTAGVVNSIEDFSWHLMEPSQGVYSFVNQDQFVNEAVSRGIRVVGDISYTPQFYSSQSGDPRYFTYPTTSTPGLTAWSNFVTATVNHFKDRVHTWQVWTNVDDHAFWGPNPGVSEYKALLDRAYAAIKAADPTATVVTAAMDPAFLNALLDLGGAPSFDVVAVHNYANAAVPPANANPAAPEASSLTALRLAALRDVVARRVPGKELWITEYGWPTAPTSPIGTNEDTQSAYLIRSMLLQGGLPYVTGVNWTDFFDVATSGPYDPNDPADNYGMLLRNNYADKASYLAYQAATTSLADARVDHFVRSPSSSVETLESFESPRGYEVFTAGGATGSFSRTSATARAGAFSGRIDYSLTQTVGSAVVIAPSPTLSLPVSGTPSRIRLWARGSGGPAPEITVSIRDATGETFDVILGLVGGTDWREYVYYLDTPATLSTLVTGGGGDNDRVIDYPIVFTGVSIRFWPIATPVGSGQVWIDDLSFESGVSIFDLVCNGTDRTVHAVWTANGTASVSIPTAAATASLRDHNNVESTVVASNGVVTVSASIHPLFVILPRGGNPTTTGVFRPSNGAIFLKNTNATGFADILLTYGIPADKPIAGDWDGDGIEAAGVFRNGVFFLRNSNTDGYAEVAFAFGAAGDLPVAGDWDGDGIDTVGVYRDGTFFLRNENTPGPPDIVLALGIAGDVPIAGDWTGKTYDSVGVFRPSNGALYLKNTNTSGFADVVLTYGIPGDKPIVGDWNGDGTDTIGVYRNGTFLLRNSNTNGFAEIVFELGISGDVPIAGDWDGLR
jgi:hypothetical protein